MVQRAKEYPPPSRSQECHTVIGDAFGSLLEVAVPCVAVGVREIPTPGKITRRHCRSGSTRAGQMLAHGARVGRLVGELIIGVQVIGDHVRAGVHQRGEHGRGVDAAAEQHTDPPAAGVEAHGIEQQLIGNLGVLRAWCGAAAPSG